MKERLDLMVEVANVAVGAVVVRQPERAELRVRTTMLFVYPVHVVSDVETGVAKDQPDDGFGFLV